MSSPRLTGSLPLSTLNRVGLALLRGYLWLGVVLVGVRVYQLARGHG